MKIFRNVIISFLLFILIFSISGCDRREIYTEGIFEYQKVKDRGVDIIGLTDQGQKQEIVIFPSSIPNADYVNIGDTIGGYPYDVRTPIKSNNLKIAIIGNVNMIAKETFFDIAWRKLSLIQVN